jgi:hypothetical protein
VKKARGKVVEMVGKKIWRYVTGELEFENGGQRPRGPNKGGKKTLKKIISRERLKNVVLWRTAVYRGYVRRRGV